MLLTPRRLWGAVAGLSIDQLVAWGILYYAYTVLSAPVALDLGISRLQVAAAFSVCLLVAGWVGRYVGSVLDTRGTRGVLRAGAIAAPLAFAAIALAGGVASLIALFALLGVVQALALYEPAFRAIVDWCPDERVRSRAMLGLTIVGGFASTVFLPFTGWLLSQHGWRQTVLVLAMMLAFVLVPLRFSLPLSSRGHARRTTVHVSPPPSATRLALGFAMHALASTGVFVYLMWHLVERGQSLAGAAAIAGLAGAAQVPGRIVLGPLRRATGSAAFLPILLVTQAASLLGVVVARGVIATACVLVFGAASGMMTLERATVVVEWYGRDGFGGHQGRLAAATSTARAVSPFVVEAGHHFVNYAVVFGLLGVVLVLGAWACRTAASKRARELSSRTARASKGPRGWAI
ncbi:MAG TPA: MFS transporter [Polyangiaceae bacterium]